MGRQPLMLCAMSGCLKRGRQLAVARKAIDSGGFHRQWSNECAQMRSW